MKRAKAKLSAEASGLSTPSTAADSSAAALVPFEDAPSLPKVVKCIVCGKSSEETWPYTSVWVWVWYGMEGPSMVLSFEFAGLVNGLV